MKKLIVLVATFTVFTITGTTLGDIYFPVYDLSSPHTITISGSGYSNADVRIDYGLSNTPGTHVDVVAGADVYFLGAYGYSTITMSGGSVLVLDAWSNSSITIDSGSVVYLTSANNSTIGLSGGAVTDVTAYDNSTTTISGGAVSRNLKAISSGTIFLEGSNFKVNGQALSNGDKVSDFVTFDAYWNDYHGTITGTLADGASLNNSFRILNTGYQQGTFAGTADIIIITCDYNIVGDLDNNCKVNLGDLALMAANWMIDCNTTPSNPACLAK